IRISTLVIEVHHFRQRLQTAVVHVGRGMLYLPQGRRLEGSPILAILGDDVSSQIRLRLVQADAQVGIAVPGEGDPFVALVALAIGPSTCSSSVEERPSQNWARL